jgi:multimeric flavodoxin WrbA
MKAILLDGSLTNDNTGQRVNAAVVTELQNQGWEVAKFSLREQKIGNCAGDFFCWIRTPGVCNVNDDNRAIAQELVNSDLLVYLTPITFGGYSSTLKGMVDHQIQVVSPFFTKIEGETHHHRRYKQNPDLLAVGWLDAPDAHSEALFRHLVQRNAINWHAKKYASGVVFSNQSAGEMAVSAQKWVNDLGNGQPPSRVALPINGNHSTVTSTDSAKQSWATSDPGSVVIRRALLLVGSPKTRKSTSNSLGGYLFEQLETLGIQTETIYLHTILRNAKKMQALLEALEVTDLVTLAFPIYVDALPAPVTEALEHIAVYRQGREPSQRPMFTAIANCGFPEAHHCSTALAICETFSRQAGFEWSGSLALGGGQMLNGTSLVEAGGMAIRIRKSLEDSAIALAQGQAVPQTAQEMMAKPVIPHMAYRLMSGFRWLVDAKSYGSLRSLRSRPYLSKAG